MTTISKFAPKKPCPQTEIPVDARVSYDIVFLFTIRLTLPMLLRSNVSVELFILLLRLRTCTFSGELLIDHTVQIR